jgi:hypothetical protein
VKARVLSQSDPAGRVFKFSERSEQLLVGAMRDIDEMMAAARRMYPGNTWTRLEIIELFFLDSATDQLQTLIDRSEF